MNMDLMGMYLSENTAALTEMTTTYENITWRDYLAMNGTENFQFNLFLTLQEFHGGDDFLTALNRVWCEEITYKVTLSKDGEIQYFKSCKDAGDYLGCSYNKVANNRGKEVSGYHIELCKISAITDKHGNILELATV